jgi:hypothetical protein
VPSLGGRPGLKDRDDGEESEAHRAQPHHHACGDEELWIGDGRLGLRVAAWRRARDSTSSYLGLRCGRPGSQVSSNPVGVMATWKSSLSSTSTKSFRAEKLTQELRTGRGDGSSVADPGQQVPDEGLGELVGEGLVGDEEAVVAGAPELVDDHLGVDVLA